MLAGLELATAQGLDATLEIRGPTLTAAERGAPRGAPRDRRREPRPARPGARSSRPSPAMRSRRCSLTADVLLSATQPDGSETLDKVVYEAARPACRCSRATSCWTSSSATCRSGFASRGAIPPISPGPARGRRGRAGRARRGRASSCAGASRPVIRSSRGPTPCCASLRLRGRGRRDRRSTISPCQRTLAPPADRPEAPPDPPRREPRDIRSSGRDCLHAELARRGARRLLSIAALVVARHRRARARPDVGARDSHARLRRTRLLVDCSGRRARPTGSRSSLP